MARMTADDFTIGVEEEYQIVHPETRALRARQESVLPRAQESVGDDAQPELHLAQIEIATPVCRTLADVRSALARERRAVITAAERDGNRIAAAGTHPFTRPAGVEVTPKERYREIERRYRRLAHETLIFGYHVHVGLRDRAMALPVLNHLRLWLAPLLALSASSPFWEGADTGYASYRTEVWWRWPNAGPPGHFASREDYDALVRDLIATGSIDDASNIYWDARLPEKTETVEVRVADVCTTIDEAVMIAGLTRALVRACYDAALRREPVVATRPEIVRSAHWRAARFGLDADLIDVVSCRSVPAPELVGALLRVARPSLEDHGDWDEVAAFVGETLRHGNGAARQRAAYRRAGRIEDVVDLIVAETARGAI